jgi:uncharacterized protein (TIGR02270 family)
MSRSRAVRWDICEEHLDEAAFLWDRWERALNAPNYAIDEVAVGPEERLLAHLDGLVLGGQPVAEKLLLPALGDDDTGNVTAATWALLQAEDANHVDAIVEALAKAGDKVRTALGRALELCHRGDLHARLLPLLGKSSPAIQATILRALAGRPLPPGMPDLPLRAFLSSSDRELQMAALNVVRRGRGPGLLAQVEALLGSQDAAVRDAAIETGLVLGLPAVWPACRRVVGARGPSCRLPLALVALGGAPADLQLVAAALGVTELASDALWALGFSGQIQAAQAALALVGDEEHGAVAAESFGTIAGLRIEGPFAKPPTTNNAPPSAAEDEAAPPEPKPEDDLPLPNAERVQTWWAKAHAQFQPGVRYLFGRPVTAETYAPALTAAPTWRRRLLCLEIAVRSPVDLDTSAWAAQQSAQQIPPLRFEHTLVMLTRPSGRAA